MKKLDTCEMQVLNHTLQVQISHAKDLLRDMENGKIDLAYVQKMIDMNKAEIIETHKRKFKYWQQLPAKRRHRAAIWEAGKQSKRRKADKRHH